MGLVANTIFANLDSERNQFAHMAVAHEPLPSYNESMIGFQQKMSSNSPAHRVRLQARSAPHTALKVLFTGVLQHLKRLLHLGLTQSSRSSYFAERAQHATRRLSFRRAVGTVALAVTGLLALSSCESLSTVAVQPGGVITGTVDMSGDAAVLETAGFDCQKIDVLIQSKGGATLGGGKGAYQVKDQSDTNTMHCVIDFNSGASVAGTAILAETPTTYVFSIPRDTLSAANVRTLKLLNPTFTLSVAMPGKIISAPGATIQANTATFTNTDVLVNGLNVEGEKTPPKNAPKSQAKAPTIVRTATTPLERSVKLGILEWALIGIGVFLTVVLIIGIRRQRARIHHRQVHGSQELKE